MQAYRAWSKIHSRYAVATADILCALAGNWRVLQKSLHSPLLASFLDELSLSWTQVRLLRYPLPLSSPSQAPKKGDQPVKPELAAQRLQACQVPEILAHSVFWKSLNYDYRS